MANLRKGHLDNHILPNFGSKRVKEIRANQVEDWLLQLDKASSTKNHILETFRIVMDEAKSERIIDANPIQEVEPVSRSKYSQSDSLSAAELKKFFPGNTKKLLKIWRRDDLIVTYFLMVSSGIRSGEARALPWKNVLWSKSRDPCDPGGKGRPDYRAAQDE